MYKDVYEPPIVLGAPFQESYNPSCFGFRRIWLPNSFLILSESIFLRHHSPFFLSCRCCSTSRSKGWWRNSQAPGRSSPCLQRRCRWQGHRDRGSISSKCWSRPSSRPGRSTATSGASQNESFGRCWPICSVNACACHNQIPLTSPPNQHWFSDLRKASNDC